jgi:hypothetical protein
MKENYPRASSPFPRDFLATCTSSVPALSCAQHIPLVSFAVIVTKPTSVPAILSHTRSTQSITLPLFLSFQRLADSFSLLPLFFAFPSFLFNRLQTLSAKHRGYGVSTHAIHESPVTNYESHNFVPPLFSWPYKLLFPQALSFHNHLRCPPGVAPSSSRSSRTQR